MASIGDVDRNVTITFIGRDNASRAMNSIGGSATKTTSTVSKLTAVLKKAAIAAGVALAAAAAAAGYFAIQFIKSAVDAAGKFEQSMNVLQNALGVTGDKMQQMERYALRMGASTVFSAQDAGDAMIELAKAGLTSAEIKGGALAATMSVAATEGLALADTAIIVSNAMATFSIKASDTTSVADALAGGSAASTASVKSLSIALGQVGVGAADAGLSLQETVGTLAAFDEMGLKGSDAGTSLKTMLAKLVPTTQGAATAMSDYNLQFTDAEGNFKSITNIAGQLADGLGDLSDKERTLALTTIFGSDARRAATVLMNQGEEGLRKFIKSTQKQGAAAKMADARMKGWSGAVEQLSGAWETFQIKFGKKLLPMLAGFATFLADTLVPAISKHLVPWVKRAAKWLGEKLPKAADKIREWWDSSGKETWTNVWEKTKDVIESAKDAAASFEENLWPAIKDVAKALRDVARDTGKVIEEFDRLIGGSGAESIGFWDLLGMSLSNALIPLRFVLWTLEQIREAFIRLIEMVPSITEAWGAIGDAMSGIGSWAMDMVDPRGDTSADGGWLKRRAMGGWTMVGEHGPELINNRGFVKPHSASMGAGGGGNVYVTVQGAIDPVGTARQIRNILAKGDRASGRGALGLA